MHTLQKSRVVWVSSGLVILLLLCIALSLFVGGKPLNLDQVFQDPLSPDYQILFYSRLPRVLLGVIVGFALSSGGVAFQSLLRNPLADPYILGVSGGAALGSVIAVALGLHFVYISALAFLFALLSLVIIYSVAQEKGRLPIHTLLLTGVIFNALAFATIMLINSLVNLDKFYRIWFLLVGSLEVESYSKILIAGALVWVGFGILFLNANKMNIISLGEDNAQYLGVALIQFRRMIFFAASLMVGAVVSLSGLIGFVGLFIPHIARLIFGSDHRLLLPASALLGASFLVLADLVARSLLSGAAYQTELPVGVITALIGGPLFILLIKRPRQGSSHL